MGRLRIISSIIALIISFNAIAQGTSDWHKSLRVGSDTLAPGAKFQVSGTDRGSISDPKMTTAQKNAIASPVEGLGVWDITLGKKSGYTGGAWHEYLYEALAATITNKIIDGDDNTLQDIALTSLKAGNNNAAIARNNSGVAYDSGVTISETNEVTAYSFTANNPASTSTFSGVQINNSQLTATGSTNLDLNTAGVGVITMKKNTSHLGYPIQDYSTDSTAGSNITLAALTKKYVRLTGAVTSIDMIPGPASGGFQELVLVNATGSSFLLNDETGATAAYRVRTGTSEPIEVQNNSSIALAYDATSSRWIVTGGVGGGGTLDGKGQMDASTVEVKEFHVPRKQLTVTDSTNKVALIETGNNNLIQNPGFEAETLSHCNLYYDGDVAEPIDGTGGSPTGVTLATQASTLKFGEKELKFSKDASSRRGMGFACDFKSPPGLAGEVVRHLARYSTTTNYADYGTAVPGSDVGIYLYDVTNSRLIRSPISDLKASNRSLVTKEFQLSGDNTSTLNDYRLIYHIQTTNASAWDLISDEMFVGYKEQANAPPLSGTFDYTPAITSTGGGSVTFNTGGGNYVAPNGTYYQSGEYLHYSISFRNGSGGAATGNAGTIVLGLPAGLTVDTSKLVDVVGSIRADGVVTNASDNYVGSATYNASSNGLYLLVNGISSFVAVSNLGANIGYTVTGKLPIAGWKSSVPVSEQGGGRKLITTARPSSDQVISTAAETTINLTGVILDYPGSISGNTIVIAESGEYDLVATVGGYNYTAGESYYVYIRKGSDLVGIAETKGTSGGEFFASTHSIVSLKKGDVITFTSDAAVDSSYSIYSFYTRLSVAKRSSPEQMYGTPDVSVRAWQTSGQNIPNNTLTTITWNNIEGDAYTLNPSTGLFTAPYSGWYSISSRMLTTSQSWTEGSHYVQMEFEKNSSRVSATFYSIEHTMTDSKSITMSDIVYLARGETLRVRLIMQRGADTPLNPAAHWTTLAISRIGN